MCDSQKKISDVLEQWIIEIEREENAIKEIVWGSLVFEADPKKVKGPFCGIGFLSSYRGFLDYFGKSLMTAYAALKDQGGDMLGYFVRGFNGHTALMCGRDQSVVKMVGWDPDSFIEAFLKSKKYGYDRMPPISGRWRDDTRMKDCPGVRYIIVKLTEEQYEKFRRLLIWLEAHEHPKMLYAFRPAFHKSKGGYVIGNCGLAAFKVLGLFLRSECGDNTSADALDSFLVLDRNPMRANFGQGQLMQWVKALENGRTPSLSRL